jgi:antitoxin (DNA-binding transcriptional repressor) of toxin-antitoxin stability system
MKSVGIKDLKNNLSRYLRDVRGGESLWVTDRNRIVAEIHPPRGDAPEQRSRLEAWMDQQSRAGQLRFAGPADSVPSMRKFWREHNASLPRLDLSAVLDETRSDRR